MKVMDGRQLKAGRVILGLTAREMAEAAGLHRNSVLNVEAQTTLPVFAHAADRIAAALEARGVEFDVSNGKATVRFEGETSRSRKRYTRRAA